jgi:hypothetical protein
MNPGRIAPLLNALETPTKTELTIDARRFRTLIFLSVTVTSNKGNSPFAIPPNIRQTLFTEKISRA